MNLAQQLAWLQANTHATSIEVNEHRIYYEDLADYLDKNNVLPSERAACLKSGQVVVCQCYPDTPIGFYRITGATIELVVDCVYQLVRAERERKTSAEPSGNTKEADRG